jgi:hypothetical protein
MRHGSNSKGEARWVASDITTGLVVAARTVAPQPEERERERRERAKGLGMAGGRSYGVSAQTAADWKPCLDARLRVRPTSSAAQSPLARHHH